VSARPGFKGRKGGQIEFDPFVDLHDARSKNLHARLTRCREKDWCHVIGDITFRIKDQRSPGCACILDMVGWFGEVA
jgi:hypothetical protein